MMVGDISIDTDGNILCKTTICANCSHRIIESERHANVWWANRCNALADSKKMEVNPVTGKMGYKITNNLGGEYFDDNPYDYCRDINTGACPHFHSNGDED